MSRNANVGRTPIPPNLKVLNGQGPTKDGTPTDSGGRPIEPTPDFSRGTPTKPDHLQGDAEWLWDQVVEQMETVGLLKPIDGPGLEVMAETFARWRAAVRDRNDHGSLSKNSQGTVTAPWVGIEERASKEFRAWCAEYGITPAAENNLKAQTGAGSGADDIF